MLLVSGEQLMWQPGNWISTASLKDIAPGQSFFFGFRWLCHKIA